MVPKIRIKGFTEDWEKTAFADLYERSIVKNDLSFGTDKIISVANMYFSSSVSQSDEEYLRSYNVMRLGDIAFEGNKSKNYAHGRFVENTIGDGIVSHVFVVLSPKSDVYDLNFWKYYINNEKVMGKILVRCTKSSTMMTDIVIDDFLKEKICVPSYEEQKEIGKILASIDKQITNNANHLTALKQIKSASLKALFPENNSTTPKLRFAGFTGEWKKVLLNECLSVSNEKNLSNIFGKDDVLSVSDDFGVCNQIKLLGRSYAGKSVSNYGVLKTGEVVYTKSPLKAKPFGIIKTNHGTTGIVSTLYAIYTPKEGVSADFIEVYFNDAERMNKYIHPLVNKGAKNDMKVSSENALKGYIRIPSLEEQQKISDYFVAIDKQIFLQSEKLEKLKQIKSACLDQMFI